MRTTLTLEDDAFATASAYAKARALRLGQAVSELIRRGSSGPLAVKEQAGVWIFDLPVDARPVTAEDVKGRLDDFP